MLRRSGSCRMMRRRCVKIRYECMHGTCLVTVHLCLLLQRAAILQQLYAMTMMMMMQGRMPWGVPIHGPSYQAALQDPLGQHLEPLGQMAQQPSTAQLAVMQQTPHHLTSLLDSSVVRETSCPFSTRPAVGGDWGAVDPPTQGALH